MYMNLCIYIERYIELFHTKKSTVMHPLKILSYKLFNNKYMIASTQITNTEIFAFTAVLFF